MAIATEVSTAVYPGNNSSSIEYPVPFPALDPSHIKVGVRPVGEAFTVLPSWKYAVARKAGGGHAVTTTDPIPVADTVIIFREVPITQPVELPLAGRLPSTAIESALDRATMQIQQLSAGLDRCLQLDPSANVQGEITPDPNSIFGFDAEGNFALFDQARVRELAQLDGIDSENPIATWANAAARAATVPAFTGQIGTQRDDGSLWVATATTAGAWAAARAGGSVVRNEAELLVALAAGGPVIVDGEIVLTSTLVLDQQFTDLCGSGTGGRLVLQHDAAGITARTVVKIAAKNVAIRDLEITANHPLSTHVTLMDTGIELESSAVIDVSGLRLERVRVNHVGNCIVRWSGPTSPFADDVQIVHCKLSSFTRHGIYFQYKVRGVQIIGNRIFGRDYGDSHRTDGNGIWHGNFADYPRIAFNHIAFCGRHGIEYWNSNGSPSNVDGNMSAKIAFNTLHDPLFTAFDVADSNYLSFGISAFGNGTLQVIGNSCTGFKIGFEFYSDPTNVGGVLAVGNSADQTLQQGFSINGVAYGVFANNYIGRVDAAATGVGANNGMQIINGGKHLSIKNNRFHNAGNFGLLVIGKRCVITGITQAADAVFTVSSFPYGIGGPNGWFVGKDICLREIGGMTGLNDRYYKITEIAGLTFKVGVDTSAMSAYTSGGIVQENYVGLHVSGNEFVCTEVIGAAPFSRAIWIADIQQAVVRDNVRFAVAGLAGAGSFSVVNKGIVYHDNTGTPITTSAADLATIGSNQDVVIFPG